MVDNTSTSLECLICLELLCEPVTTICGHTFCRYCLIQYLSTKPQCPICRKPILSDRNTLSKNILLDDLARQANKTLYEERLRLHKLQLNELHKEDNSEQIFPCLFLDRAYFFPNQIKKMILNQNFQQGLTLQYANQGNRLIVVIPSADAQICSLCDILSVHVKQNRNNDNQLSLSSIDLIMRGNKRIEVSKVENMPIEGENRFITVCSGKLRSESLSIDPLHENQTFNYRQIEISENELSTRKEEILEKCFYVNCQYSRLHSNISIGVQRLIDTQFGKPVVLNRDELMSNDVKFIETIEKFVFMFISMLKLKEDTKQRMFDTFSLKEKVDIVYRIFKDKEDLIENPILVYELFDLKIAGSKMNETKFTLFLVIGILFLFIAYRLKVIHLD